MAMFLTCYWVLERRHCESQLDCIYQKIGAGAHGTDWKHAAPSVGKV
ncbi:MAG: hypothetical protein KCHDKBKB_00211 [Elusimicrobia bacterium]|nr:hypothetical protein [Elusimicrobiota bacterium]